MEGGAFWRKSKHKSKQTRPVAQCLARLPSAANISPSMNIMIVSVYGELAVPLTVSVCDLCFKFSSFALFLLWTVIYFFCEQSQSGFLSHLQQVNTADTLWRTPIAGAVPKSQKGISGIYQKMTAGIESIINNLLLYNAPTRSRVIMTSLL